MKRGYTYDWFPFFRSKWLWGSTRHELEPAERSVFVDLLCLAGNDDGLIQANPETPYPHAQLAAMFCVPLEVLESTLRKCLDPKIAKLQEVRPGIYYVVNWEAYSLSTSRKKAAIPKAAKEAAPKIDLDRTRWLWTGIEPADYKTWNAAYPAVDIPIELSKMVAWIQANPTKGHKSNWRKFITNWLSRSQDRGGTNRSRFGNPAGNAGAGDWARQREAKEKARKP